MRPSAQPDTVLDDPEQFWIRIALRVRGGQIHVSGIHPAPGVSRGARVHPMTQ
jgi:hypothetical protein